MINVLYLIQNRFPLKLNDLNEEYGKLGISRIFIGIVVFSNAFQLAGESRFYFETYDEFYYGLIFSVLTLLFTIGFFTPIVTILLFLFLYKFYTVMQCYTLANSILILYFWLFIITNFGGAKYSLDNFLIRKNYKLSKLLIKCYNISGNLSLKKLKTTYLFVLIAYAILSFGAALFHLQDSSWINGTTAIELLTSSYLSKFYNFFRYIHLQLPLFFIYFSKFSMFGQLLFQVLMIPLLFNEYGLKFIKLWGLGFFIVSLLFIQLSSLPHFELIIWFIIFYRKKNKERINILYDDFCNLCKRAVKFFKVINFNNAIVFMPLSKNIELVEKNRITQENLRNEMHGIYNKQIIIGYQLYTTLCWKNPLLLTVWPIMVLGRVTKIGPLIYSYIAKRRLKLFGTCELSFDVNRETESKINLRKTPDNVFKFYSLCVIFVCLIYIFFDMPIVSDYPKKIVEEIEHKTDLKIKHNIEGLLFRYTPFVTPNVFNTADLTMGNNWTVIYRQTNNTKEIVPITSIDGGRLNYSNFDWLLFGNHNTDILYYGNTLRYRRAFIGMDALAFHQKNAEGYNFILKRIKYDYKKTNQIGKKTYFIEIYQHKESLNLEEPNYDKKLLHSYNINYIE